MVTVTWLWLCVLAVGLHQGGCVAVSTAAPPPADHGLSAGSVLLILSLVFLALYLSLGVLFNKAVKGATGLELLPNVSFWAALPGLAKEGVVFTFTSVRARLCGGEGGQAGYDQL